MNKLSEIARDIVTKVLTIVATIILVFYYLFLYFIVCSEEVVKIILKKINNSKQ